MVTTETTAEAKVEVRVIRLRVCLAKVVFPEGYHLVVGGRLVLSVKGGVKTPHPELPAYRMEDFPVPYLEWADGDHPEVRVEARGHRKMRPVSVVRAYTVLFTPCGEEAVHAFLKGGAR